MKEKVTLYLQKKDSELDRDYERRKKEEVYKNLSKMKGHQLVFYKAIQEDTFPGAKQFVEAALSFVGI